MVAMGRRKQIHLGEADERVLTEESRRSGLSASELIRRAIQQCYGCGRKLTWQEVLNPPLEVGSRDPDYRGPDSLFDDGWDKLADWVLGREKP
jgi:hypothetical protein